jgi:hypothetical protein
MTLALEGAGMAIAFSALCFFALCFDAWLTCIRFSRD